MSVVHDDRRARMNVVNMSQRGQEIQATILHHMVA